tara:strand:+ start:451 stop:657 length:207 start_codon:yes stop_codon:yes gene_type:complete
MKNRFKTINLELCPVCKKVNGCFMEKEKKTGIKQGRCWCEDIDFNSEFLANLPADAKSCLCKKCATSN